MLIELEKGDCFTICLWAEDDGTCEAQDFFDELQEGGKREKRDLQLIERRIKRMAHHGVIFNEEQSKELEDGVYEFKASGGARLLWFYDKTQRRVVICTHGFHKPPSNRGYKPQIDKLKAIRKSYLKNDR